MSIEDRTITEIKIEANDEELTNLRHKALKKFIAKRIGELESSLKKMCAEFEERFKNNEWILIDESYFYVNDVVAFVPSLESNIKWDHHKSTLPVENIDDKYLRFEGKQGEIPTEREARAIFEKFRQKTGKIKCLGDNYYDGVTIDDGKSFYLISDDKKYEYGTVDIKEKKILTFPIYRLNGKDSKKISVPEVILLWLKEKVSPDIKTKEIVDSNLYSDLKNLKSKGYSDYLQASSNTIVFENKDEVVDKIYNECLNNVRFNFLRTKELRVETILNDQKVFEADEEFLAKFKEKFLECDERRANLREYTEEKLTGMEQGHWDLFDYNDSIDSEIIVKLPKTVYSRDPKEDIQTNWVGIDFGTKSTVVSFRDNDEGQNIIPINVGKVQGTSDLNDYENPSIMYFVDFKKFLEDYNSKKGRPDTKWEDLVIAHDALNYLKNADERNFESFLTDLKSWCGSNDIVRVKPQKNNRPVEFKKFLEIGDKDLNPVEYYAYFLGLYINNMQRGSGKIFMRYKISFPVTYEPKLRKKIVDSFEKGIKKSFPTSLLNNAKAMKRFKIDSETSEPAAYAVTALEKYNFKPSDDEQEYYGVFDFGGGTSDFDFGVYSKFDEPNTNDDEDDEEDSGFDYSLIRFGNNGDRRLGGEKLLKYLAFEIFKANRDRLSFDDGTMIQFTLDEGRSEAECIGFEDLINNQSTYANRNMYNLMETLRWAWEGFKPNDDRSQRLQEDYCNKGFISLDLINNKGIKIPDFALSSYRQNEDGSSDFIDLQELLQKRIDKAVELFFTSMKEAFKKGANDKRYDIKPLDKISNINIFLAGNSSKSKLFQDILNSYITEKTEDDSSESNLNYDYSMKEYATDPSSVFIPPSLSSFGHSKAKEILGLDDKCPVKFTIYPPLGIEEARKIQQQRGYNVKIEDMMTEPTGKTGVAYGLLVDRIDVKTVSATEDGEVGFLFYFGKSKKGNKFHTIIDKDSALNIWQRIYVMREDKEEYRYLYTTLAEAGSGEMDAKKAKANDFPVDIDDIEDGKEILVRALSKNSIEWRIVTKEKGRLLNGKKDDSKPIEENIIELK